MQRAFLHNDDFPPCTVSHMKYVCPFQDTENGFLMNANDQVGFAVQCLVQVWHRAGHWLATLCSGTPPYSLLISVPSGPTAVISYLRTHTARFLCSNGGHTIVTVLHCIINMFLGNRSLQEVGSRPQTEGWLQRIGILTRRAIFVSQSFCQSVT